MPLYKKSIEIQQKFINEQWLPFLAQLNKLYKQTKQRTKQNYDLAKRMRGGTQNPIFYTSSVPAKQHITFV